MRGWYSYPYWADEAPKSLREGTRQPTRTWVGTVKWGLKAALQSVAEKAKRPPFGAWMPLKRASSSEFAALHCLSGFWSLRASSFHWGEEVRQETAARSPSGCQRWLMSTAHGGGGVVWFWWAQSLLACAGDRHPGIIWESVLIISKHSKWTPGTVSILWGPYALSWGLDNPQNHKPPPLTISLWEPWMTKCPLLSTNK